MTILTNDAADTTLKARGDKGAGRSQAFQFESPHLLRTPYLNLQNIYALGRGQYLKAAPWRRVLYSSPTVWACVKVLTDQLVALPWRITTKDKSERHRKKGKIDYYTEEVVDKFNGENYDVGVMRGNRDVLTIPQGGNFEVIMKTSGQWAGEVDRVENIDGGTLTPTGEYWFPLIQHDPQNSENYVVFRRNEVRRILMNPRPEYNVVGYQQSPLEMCYLAIDAVSKGDFYYLNLLTDTPSAGILDFADWSKEECVEWAKSWRELLTGSDALKIPMVYEHEKPISWIPFGVPPEKIMLDEAFSRYTKLIHSCFGIYTQDTGLQESDIAVRGGQGGAVLERRSWYKFNALVALWENFWNSILPNDLIFKYEEVNIDETERLARASVAKANMWGILARGQIVGIREIRAELVESGLWETYINAEEIPEDVMAIGIGGGINPVVSGGSRWTEQRLPAEGRRQQLPAPKQSQREEWYNRVRPKSLATISNLNTILANAFEKIAIVPDDALQQIIHDIGVLLIPVIHEAKSLTDESLDRWLQEFYLLDEGKESLLKSKAIIRKQRKASDIAQELLKEHNWWDIKDESLLQAVVLIFKSAYEDALDNFANEVWQALYEEGLVESPIPDDYTPSIVNSLILGEIDAYANRMVENLNSGTQYYLRHALTRSTMSHLKAPEVRSAINKGDDPATIIATLGLIDDIAATFKSELINLVLPRAERAAGFEIANIEGSARLEAMKSMGLTTKRWNIYGPNPCPICIGNAAAGDVGLDYQYDSAFGFTLWPLAHPFGMCEISFDKAELRAIIDTGRELTLYRGD